MKVVICWFLGHKVWKTRQETGVYMPVVLFNLTDGKQTISDIKFCTRCSTLFGEPPLVKLALTGR